MNEVVNSYAIIKIVLCYHLYFSIAIDINSCNMQGKQSYTGFGKASFLPLTVTIEPDFPTFVVSQCKIVIMSDDY